MTSPDSYQIGPETFVTLRTRVFDAEGELASEAETVGIVFGFGQLLPEVERALEGHVAGDTVDLQLSQAQAYGGRDPKGILEVDRADFPESVSPGDRFEVENLEGGLLVFHVLDVQEDCVVVDTNHPLAGQDVRFMMEIRDVRPATSDELTAAEAVLEEDTRFLEGQDLPDVTASRLIRGPAAR